MPSKTSFRFCVPLFCLLLSRMATGQQVPGLPNFGSFSGGATDTVNNANLNVHFEFPVMSRAGRGLPFSYTLSYDSEVWFPVTSGGTTVWNPSPNWGWGVITQPQLGYISYASSPVSCVGPPPANQHVYWTISTNFTYVDSVGTSHSFGGLAVSTWPSGSQCGGGPPTTNSGTASDDSGYFLSIAVNGSSVNTTLSARSGAVINAPQNGPGSGSVVDTNGNVISVSNGSTAYFYDTLSSSSPALSVSGAGAPSSPRVFAYTNPSGSSSHYQVNYANYSVRTNFGCSGISEYTSASQPLVSSIALPDGTSYSFSYEPTPGYSGSVTGRLQSITLPTGGTMTYSYSGGSHGITCADGSTATLARTTRDGTWTYAHTESGSAGAL